ncbi:hypothetical protein MJO29_012432 [Puccinia striiformis f. sp. tritici]|nr:hypothetical protein MJO29_012432 [Puccinia striiformis f. sp. tritici]
MKQNTAPGKSGVLAVHLKKFLEVECQLQITKDWENAPQNAFGDKSYPKQLNYSNVALDRWSLPSDLMTPPLKHLLNIMRGFIRLKTQPALWNEEVLITLPKPGQDPGLLENTRGITLSCTEGKFLLTILARDVSSKLESEGFFTDAQAGFRCGQEAMAHVITLNEILKRRRNSGMDTYVIYIDFKKAFDRVPHEGLWAKLLQIGIHPDLVQIICKGYDNSTIQCRLGEDLSEPFTQKIGTRQGCPLSPLLFIIFVNDILEKVTKGITVPGLTKPAKGLLFADNTLIFADSPSEAQAICDKLNAYCADWHFALGHKKCGVVRYGCEPTADVESEDITYILKEWTIQTVPTYKYLGCLIPNTVLPEDPYPVETGHAKLLAKKAENTMHMSLPILYDKDLHPLTKARVIQSYIMAVGSYGAEWIAMCQKRTRTIQVVLDKASKICFGLKEANKTVNTLLLSLELGVTPLSIHCTLQRIRLWNQGHKPGTLLKDLIKFPYHGKGGTWTSNTLTNIKKLVNQESNLNEDDEEGDPLATHHTLTWIASMRKNRLDLHPKHPSPIGTNERVSPEQKEQLAQLETFHVTLLEKEVRQEAKKSQSVARYDRYELGRSANFVSTSINIPDITRGIHYLCLLRMNALPSLSRRIQALTAQKINHTLKKGICPCCKANAVDSGPEEWCHILLTCLFFRDIRDATIGGTVLYLIEKIWEIPRDMEDQHIYVLLMGGLLRTHIKENPREKSVEETEYESPALTTWVNGYGHIPHLYPAEFAEHGYVPVARFLQAAVPKYTEALYVEGLSQAEPISSSLSDRGNALSGSTLFFKGVGSIQQDQTTARPHGMPESTSHKGDG